MPKEDKAKTCEIEECWMLVGQHRGRIWYGRRIQYSHGNQVRVCFDGAWALKREEDRGDVIGFLHTHPNGPSAPSGRDVRTMRAWCSAFGKPLVCVIADPDGMHGYRFDDDESEGVRLKAVEEFPRSVVIGVDTNGR